MNMDPVNIINTILCTAIFILGVSAFSKKRRMPPLLIGAAFGIFAVSHVITLLGMQNSLTNFLIIIRVFAYLLVVLALWNVAVTPPNKPQN